MKRRLLVIMTIAIFALSFNALADYKIVQKVHTDGMMGQPAKEQTNTIYMSGDWVRQETEGMIFLFDAGKGDMYFLNEAKKEYSIVNFEKLKPLLQSSMGMLGEMKTDVKKTGNTKKVGEWNTEEWKLTLSSKMFTMDLNLYNTTAIKFPDTYKKFNQKYADLMGPMGDMMKKMAQVEGFTVLTEGTISVMGTSAGMSTKLIEMKEGPLPKSMFQIPDGYEEVEFNLMGMRGM